MAITLHGTSGITLPGTGTATQLGSLTRATAKTSTSGTTVEFDSIPSWVKRITVFFNEMSTTGTSGQLVQIGTNNIVSSTGYLSSSASGVTTVTTVRYTTGFGLRAVGANNQIIGTMTISNMTGNLWVATHTIGDYNATAYAVGGGSKELSGPLDIVRITTVNGTDTFDNGSINIMYE